MLTAEEADRCGDPDRYRLTTSCEIRKRPGDSPGALLYTPTRFELVTICSASGRSIN